MRFQHRRQCLNVTRCVWIHCPTCCGRKMRQLDPQMVLQFVDVFWNFGVDAFNFSTRFRAVHCPRKTQRLPQRWHCRTTWAPWPTILTCSFLINIRQVAHSFPATASRERSVRHPAEVLRQLWRGVDVLWWCALPLFFVIDHHHHTLRRCFRADLLQYSSDFWQFFWPLSPQQAPFLELKLSVPRAPELRGEGLTGLLPPPLPPQHPAATAPCHRNRLRNRQWHPAPDRRWWRNNSRCCEFRVQIIVTSRLFSSSKNWPKCSHSSTHTLSNSSTKSGRLCTCLWMGYDRCEFV